MEGDDWLSGRVSGWMDEEDDWLVGWMDERLDGQKSGG